MLVKNGMSDAMFDELKVAVEQFEAASEEVNTGRQAHVGARADLANVARELNELVSLLDGLNRFRLRNEPELLAAWESARNVVGPFKFKTEPPMPEPGETQPPAQGSELRPAA